ncbi:hypothetical protein MSM1_00340 [Mycobacterium sp. SM1]|uniref:hypothetical protein n=1 Tax=Mycobacterium sp. SM1 TaxID=2816243 RepID=UPI001BD15C57|nr:hypothetical protein [Mycobacterium sp. SM1]MBS4726881.1 hypothetical protein [Mycobacterium sp. SM1]
MTQLRSGSETTPEGPVTLYFEFRVAGPEHDAAMGTLRERASAWRQAPGFLSLMLKQMSGDSTMVKNYPEAYKGVLAEAYLDGIRSHSQPYFYSLFVRFADHAQLQASQINEDFDRAVLPFLHAVTETSTGIAKSRRPMSLYRSVFQTIAAGNRAGIYTTTREMTDFLRHPVEAPERDTVTVVNHVMVADAGHLEWEKLVLPLLEVAQETYQPTDDPNGIGQPGSKANRLYRKALSTEILRNATPDGELRAYLMHGVWESVWDHENSHLDTRLQEAFGPVGAGVVIGPIEPFYLTRFLAEA